MILHQPFISLILWPLLVVSQLQKEVHSLTCTRSNYQQRSQRWLERPVNDIGYTSRKRQRNFYKVTTSMRGGSEDDKKSHEHKPTHQDESRPLLSRLLNALIKGVTLPFPTLRNLSENIKTDNQRRKKVQVGFSLRESILAIALYLTLGMISYSSTIMQRDQAWNWVDALYFGVVTFTSVGYGDLCPTTTAGKLFTILFGLSGIAILGAAVATIGSRLVQRENSMLEAAEEAGRKRMMQLFQAFPRGASVSKDARREVPLWRQTIGNAMKRSVPAIVVLLAGGRVMGWIEGWSWLDSIYYSFITAGTLGYGDFSPISRTGRLWGILFIPLSVAAAGEVLGSVASALMERRQAQFYEQVMERELNIQRLLEMDTNQDGKVTREEYIHFMLKEMELVTEQQLEELRTQFERLDMDGGGYLDKNDLKLKLFQQDLQSKVTAIQWT